MVTQPARQVSSIDELPSSHSSPVSTTPSPQNGSLQSVRQASARVSELSPSHSSPASMTPSPQDDRWQSLRQALARTSELSLPLSHCSPGSMIVSPHDAGAERGMQTP